MKAVVYTYPGVLQKVVYISGKEVSFSLSELLLESYNQTLIMNLILTYLLPQTFDKDWTYYNLAFEIEQISKILAAIIKQ